MTKTEILEIQLEIFNLILAGGESNRAAAAEKIRQLEPSARRDLRAACQEVDNLVDDVWLEELREKRRGKQPADGKGR